MCQVAASSFTCSCHATTCLRDHATTHLYHSSGQLSAFSSTLWPRCQMSRNIKSSSSTFIDVFQANQFWWPPIVHLHQIISCRRRSCSKLVACGRRKRASSGSQCDRTRWLHAAAKRGIFHGYMYTSSRYSSVIWTGYGAVHVSGRRHLLPSFAVFVQGTLSESRACMKCVSKGSDRRSCVLSACSSFWAAHDAARAMLWCLQSNNS